MLTDQELMDIIVYIRSRLRPELQDFDGPRSRCGLRRPGVLAAQAPSATRHPDRPEGDAPKETMPEKRFSGCEIDINLAILSRLKAAGPVTLS